ncbi:MAG: prepilin peptidase, partial [Mycobacteriales bacterium]
MLTGVITGLLAGVLGVLAGWWTTLAIHRLPRGERILRSWPQCAACHAYLAGTDMIPLFSWMRLRGRCRSCKIWLGYRFPLLELGTGALFAVLTLRLGVSVALLAYLYFAAVCVALFVIDVKVHRLPDVLTLPS